MRPSLATRERTCPRGRCCAPTYWNLGRHVDALPLEERALAITDKTLGPGHPSMAILLGNLAATYRDLGRDADAHSLEERAERIRQRRR